MLAAGPRAARAVDWRWRSSPPSASTSGRRRWLSTSASSTRTRRRRRRSTRSRSRPSATRTSRPSPRCSSGALGVAGDDAARLNVLQKLGAIYSERLHDHAKAEECVAAGPRSPARAREGAPRAARQPTRRGRLRRPDGALREQQTTGRGSSRSSRAPPTRRPTRELKVDSQLPLRATSTTTRSTRPERAFRAYERVLSVQPDDARAASALVPLYEKDEKWGRLPALYEVLLAPRRGPGAAKLAAARQARRGHRAITCRTADGVLAGRARRTSSRRGARARSRRSRRRRGPPASGQGSSRR